MEPVKLFQYNTLEALMAGLYGEILLLLLKELLDMEMRNWDLDSIDGRWLS